MEGVELGGVIHLALCGDEKGLIMRWKTRLKAYIDPGDTQSSLKSAVCRVSVYVATSCKQSRDKLDGQVQIVMQAGSETSVWHSACSL